MANVVKAEVEAAFKLLKENGFKGVPDEAANGGLVMVGNGANITINVNNGVIGDNNTNVGSNIINSGVNDGETINRLLSIYHRGAKSADNAINDTINGTPFAR